MQMASTKKLSSLYSSPVFLCAFFAFKVLGEISSPNEVIGKAGQDAIFMYNTSGNDCIILGAKFGLYGNKNVPIPKFITVINKKGEVTVTCGDDLDGPAASYKGRVSFTGDLDKGHAWFQISNLSLNDTNLYSSSIRRESDQDYKQTKPVKLTVLDTDKKLPPLASEARFTDFKGIAWKNFSSNRILAKESLSTVYEAITNAYRDISIDHEIKIVDISKVNKTVTAVFHITFSKAINKTFAFSFLERAQRNNQLRGYNITCFDKLDLKPKPDKPSSFSPYLVAVFVFLGFVVVLLVVWFVCYRLCLCLEPFNKLVIELLRRLRKAVCKHGD